MHSYMKCWRIDSGGIYEEQIPYWKFSFLRYIGIEMLPEDYLAFSPAYIGKDDIPEIAGGGGSATGTNILTFHNGQVNTQHKTSITEYRD